jgi:hypothetical protein
MSDAAKWGLFDLLKALDAIYGGQHHEVFRRIAEGLGLALPALPPPPPDPALGGEAEADSEADSCAKGCLKDPPAVLSRDRGQRHGQISGGVPEVKRESEQDRVYRFLSAQTEPVALAQIIAELGIRRWTVTSILYRLLKRGSIEHAGRDAWQIRSAG